MHVSDSRYFQVVTELVALSFKKLQYYIINHSCFMFCHVRIVKRTVTRSRK